MIVSNHLKRGVFIGWVPSHGRIDDIAGKFGLQTLYVHFLKPKNLVHAPLKYPFQFLVSLWKLFLLRPKLIFVMNPPVFCVLSAYIYCLLSGTRYVIDSHSGAFESIKWKWSIPLQRWLSRRAIVTLVTNQLLYDELLKWGVRAQILEDPPILPPTSMEKDPFLPNERPAVVVINTFANDEGVFEIIEAAGRLPHVKFYMTGDLSVAKQGQLSSAPSNMVFTGWLPKSKYWLFLAYADALITLTNNENTILRGSWEALYLGKPLVTSMTQTLQKYYSKGAIFVEHTPESISEGISKALTSKNKLQRDMRSLSEEKRRAWDTQREKLEEILSLG